MHLCKSDRFQVLARPKFLGRHASRLSSPENVLKIWSSKCVHTCCVFREICNKNTVNQVFWSKTTVFSLPATEMHYLLIFWEMRNEYLGLRSEDRRMRIEDRGSRIDDRGLRIEDKGQLHTFWVLIPQSSVLSPQCNEKILTSRLCQPGGAQFFPLSPNARNESKILSEIIRWIIPRQRHTHFRSDNCYQTGKKQQWLKATF